ncbi:hypothetical protein [Paraburkholderia sp. J8-2]|uniref:hypothetical protein n=1 Tax=Paraburkholderia sp. J8-2 TaxID=2805440 RepID=UPI002AB737B3|nr:hypothetical protein [Paraburkholderia sp. J8-2]
MSIDAILANMDHVWLEIEDDLDNAAGRAKQRALRQLLQCIRDEGYPLLLLSNLSAEHLNSAIGSALGENGLTYFSAILSSELVDRYAVALYTLQTAPDRVIAVGSTELELQEARSFGIARCVHLDDALSGFPL